jgi:hypothetical protein
MFSFSGIPRNSELGTQRIREKERDYEIKRDIREETVAEKLKASLNSKIWSSGS